LGYLISTVSVVLLGIVAWQSASHDWLLLSCLIGAWRARCWAWACAGSRTGSSNSEKDRIEAKADNRGSGQEPRARSATRHLIGRQAAAPSYCNI